MKKRFIIFAFLLLILSISFILAADPKVTKAYQCLEGKVVGKCSSLSPEEKAFSLLALGECKQELIDSSKKINGKAQCWPSSSCDIAVTSKALLALQANDYDTSEIANWLLSQKMVPGGLNWFLQIESNEETSCTITYQGGSAQLILGTDKKIKSLNGGGCFSAVQQDYWLQISSACQDKEFEISCDKSFLTNLLYQEANSPTIFVSEKTHTAGASGATSELIESFCFKQGGVCAYEGSLWASIALDYAGYSAEVDPFIPYLISSADSNSKYIPEAFLYHLTGDTSYKTTLLSKQRTTNDPKYWQLSLTNNKFYDTAVALYPFQNDNFTAKTGSMNWLLTQQDSNGCWEGNIRNTAFILHSIWQNDKPVPECTSDGQCSSGKICVNQTCVQGPECSLATEASDCGEGRICSLNNICVSGCRSDNTCGEGNICSSNKTCVPGCRDDTVCGDGKICNANLTCVNGCRTNEQCPADNPICSPNNKCVICTNSSQCGTGEQCLGNSCVPVTYECLGNSHCTNSTKPVCDQSTHTCVACNYDADCKSPNLECNTDTKTCVIKPECRYDSDCNVTTQVCNTATNKCDPRPQCVENGDCAAGQKCQTGKCVDIPPGDECNATNHCSNGYECNNGLCEVIPECTSDGQCATGYKCSSEHKCIPLPSDTCQFDYECPGDEICNSNGICASPNANKPRCEEDKGYFCRSGLDCQNGGGSDLSDLYECNVPDKCCSIGPVLPSCQDLNGITCSVDMSCDGGTKIYDYSDAKTGEFCCTGGGSCQKSNTGGTLSNCENQGGVCRSSCLSSESEIYESCTLSSDVCCTSSSNGSTNTGTSSGSYLWLWIFLILIVLAILGFVFRNKLSVLIMRLRSGKKKQMPFRPGLPPPTSSLPSRLIPRRIFPPSQASRPPMRPPIQPQRAPVLQKKPEAKEKSKSDLDDVLKKLKDIGK